MRCKLKSFILLLLMMVITTSFAKESKHTVCAKLETQARAAAANAKHAVSLETYLKEQETYSRIQGAHVQHHCSGHLSSFPEFTSSQHKNPTPEHAIT